MANARLIDLSSPKIARHDHKTGKQQSGAVDHQGLVRYLFRCFMRRIVYDMSWYLARFLGRISFRTQFYGDEHVPREGPVLICANHQSFLDPVLIGMASPRRLHYLARESLFKFAPFRWLIQCYNAIPIQREGLGIGGLKETLKRLKSGEAVLIFPEGTRTQDGQVQSLKPGFCSVARRAEVTLVPAGIDGAFDAWPRNRRFPMFSRITVQFGRPFRPSDYAQMSDDDLVAGLRQRIVDCLTTAHASRQKS
jgi:1-acyl-sn-glycerol-3-phosphate acyltransferase